MPELPEVETVRRGLTPTLVNQRITSVIIRRRDLRIPIPEQFENIVQNQAVSNLDRRAKYLLIHFENGQTVILHLGMSGSCTVHKPQTPYAKHDHVIFCTELGDEVRFNDPRRFGLVTCCKTTDLADHKLFTNLGPEPFSTEFSGDYLAQEFTKKNTPIKQAIMDNKIVVGVGNIYACESLFSVNIDPTTPSRNLTKNQCTKLSGSIIKILGEAIKSGGSSLKDHRQSDGTLGYFQHNFNVYGKLGQNCTDCKEPIKKIVQGGRSTFFCPKCQV